MKVLIGLVVVAVLAFFGLKQCGPGSDVTNVLENSANGLKDAASGVAGSAADVAKGAANTAAGAAKGVAGAATDVVGSGIDAAKGAASGVAGALGDLFSFKLPNGLSLKIPKFGVENKLIGFINSDTAISKDAWFNFDRINFQTGSSTLSNESQEQVKNMSAILKAYPNVKLKIGGYTDNTGTVTVNKSVSQKRADAVKAAIVALGVDSSRIATEGYGPANPVASNDTESGRAKNRRIAVRVTGK